MRRRVHFIMENVDEDPFIDSKTITRISIHTVPTFIAFLLLAVLVALYGLVYTVDSTLPKPLDLADEQTHPDAFITERARLDLRTLTDLGPRIAGGYKNEHLTVDFLVREINSIIQRANKNQGVELDVQVVTGSHYIQNKPNGKIVPYSNLQNIVVRLYGQNNASQSVLFNSHFDSVPTSPGGSDDGINVVVMLEILRKLSRESRRPLNSLIFLFNGAEETGLQAAHGFITQHKWAKDCKVVVNLEAAGVGGKMILFQSGPSAPWLLKYYSRVPHPYGQATAEEMFQSNMIPSDTDFRIFRDYGGLVGVDMAFFKNGYLYHTKYDDFDRIPLGSFQHAGDNALSLARSLGNAPEVENPKENLGKLVYFDFLGLFMISYTEKAAFIVNVIVTLASFTIFGLSIYNIKLGCTLRIVKYLSFTFGAVIGGWVAAAIFVYLIAFLIDKSGYSMSWFSHPWLIFGLYVAPTIGFSSIFFPLVNHKNLGHNVKAQIQAHCVRIIWTMVLFFGTILNIRSVYILLVPVLFNVLGFILVYICKFQHTVRKWQIIYAISLVVPTMFLMYSSLTTLSLFVPITGRIGPDKNPELTIGVISILFTVLITSPFIALTILVRNFKYFVTFLGLTFIVSVLIIFTPLGFPYSGNKESPTPQRYWALHTQRVFHDEQGLEIKKDSGYFLLNMDRNSPYKVKNIVKDVAKAKSLKDDCQKYLICGLPLVHSKVAQFIEFSTWIPAGQPLLPEKTKLDVISKEEISPNVLRYNLSISGPDRLGLYLSPKSGVTLLNISLMKGKPSDPVIWNNRDLYFVIHVYGKEAAPLQFTFDVEVPTNTSDVTTEIAISGIFVHDDKNRKMPHYVQFLGEFPDWTDVTAWLGSYESWWV